MKQIRNPKWWNTQHESRWNTIKAAFQRDWDQTKSDFGSSVPDINQDVDDTVKQAVGMQPIPPRGQPTYEEAEDAYRFGYGARTEYDAQYSFWDAKLESQLERDWQDTYSDREWPQYRSAVRRGWEYEGRETRKAA